MEEPEQQYSTPQQKMGYLYDTLREALRFKKYYAQELKRYQDWNLAGDIVIGVASSSALTNALVSKEVNWLLTVASGASAIASILKPILKLKRRIARFSNLQRKYLDLYQKLDRLSIDIKHTGTFLSEHEKRFTRLRDAFDRLGLQNEPVENDKKMRKIMDEIDEAIPHEKLWLPPSE